MIMCVKKCDICEKIYEDTEDDETIECSAPRLYFPRFTLRPEDRNLFYARKIRIIGPYKLPNDDENGYKELNICQDCMQDFLIWSGIIIGGFIKKDKEGKL